MEWKFLSNYGHVLVCLDLDSELRLRDMAEKIGITERAVQRIIHDLSESGYIQIEKEGRRNKYSIDRTKKLRHELEGGATIEDFLRLAKPGVPSNS